MIAVVLVSRLSPLLPVTGRHTVSNPPSTLCEAARRKERLIQLLAVVDRPTSTNIPRRPPTRPGCLGQRTADEIDVDQHVDQGPKPSRPFACRLQPPTSSLPRRQGRHCSAVTALRLRPRALAAGLGWLPCHDRAHPDQVCCTGLGQATQHPCRGACEPAFQNYDDDAGIQCQCDVDGMWWIASAGSRLAEWTAQLGYRDAAPVRPAPELRCRTGTGRRTADIGRARPGLLAV